MDDDAIQPGKIAPNFTLPDQGGKNHTLSDYRGRWVFLYFYPKDESPGCTAEACALRDHFEEFGKLDVAVLGVSADSIASHQHFAKKCGLPFPLLSDIHRKISHNYHAFTAHFFSTGHAEEIDRMSFLIDVMGDIEKVYHVTKPNTHAEEVLRDLIAIKKEGETRINL